MNKKLEGYYVKAKLVKQVNNNWLFYHGRSEVRHKCKHYLNSHRKKCSYCFHFVFSICIFKVV